MVCMCMEVAVVWKSEGISMVICDEMCGGYMSEGFVDAILMITIRPRQEENNQRK